MFERREIVLVFGMVVGLLAFDKYIAVKKDLEKNERAREANETINRVIDIFDRPRY